MRTSGLALTLAGLLALPGSVCPARGDADGASAGPAQPGEQRHVAREAKSFHVGDAAVVRVETFDGRVTVRGWDKPEVSFTATKSGQDAEEVRGISLRAEQRGGEVLVSATFDKAFRREVVMDGRRVMSDRAQADIEVHVPRRVRLRASSGDNGMLVEGVSGEIELHTDDGALLVRGGGGRLLANTRDGRINVTDFDGEAEVRTGDGPVSLAGRFTRVDAYTKDGSITLAIPEETNATVETKAASRVSRGGLIAAEEPGAGSPQFRRWRIGAGGNLFKLYTDDGSVVVRRLEATP